MDYTKRYRCWIFALTLVLAQLSASSFANELDDIYNLNPKTPPDISKLSPEECINQLKSGEDSIATAVILALTKDEETTLANYDRLIDALRETKGGVDEILMYQVEPLLRFGPKRDRRYFALVRIAESIKMAHDTPARRKALDSFIDLMVAVLDGKESVVDRVEALLLVNQAVFPSLYVLSPYGDEKALKIFKQCFIENDVTMRRMASTVLVLHATRDASKCKEIFTFMRQNFPGDETESAIEQTKTWIKESPQRLSYQEWREVRDHPVELLTKYLQGVSFDRARYDTAKEALLERSKEDDSSYELLCKVAGYGRGDDNLLEDLAKIIPESADAKAKARVDKLLAVHLDLITRTHRGEPATLARIVRSERFDGSNTRENILQQLQKNPPYGRDRVVKCLWLLADDTTVDGTLWRTQPVDMLKSVAWVAPDTAQQVLADAEKRLAQAGSSTPSQSGDKLMLEVLPDLVESAKKAINRYKELALKISDKTVK